MTYKKPEIVICSDDDYSTNIVIDWIRYLNKNKRFIRINPSDKIIIKSLFINKNMKVELAIKRNNSIINYVLDNKTSYWYRRGRLSVTTLKTEEIIKKNGVEKELFLETLANDSTIEEFLNHKIEGKKSIGKYSNNFTNKLINLDLAKKCNFDIPDTLITSDKRALIDFYKTHKSVICKSATQGSLIGEKTNLDGLTVLLNKNDIKLASKQFPPSLFQMNIEKSFEIRVFYLLGKTYSLAIFSQNNNKTKIDFRNYDHLNPNRTVPFCLPKNIEKKIITLMNKLSMNSGSIDLIYSKDAKYYFLEVNPVGQFDQVSYPCNYRLEKLIAMKLI